MKQSEPSETHLHRSLVSVANLAGTAVGLTGMWILGCWLWGGADAVAAISTITVKTNAALILLLSGLSLVLLSSEQSGWVRRSLGRSCAALVGIISALTLTEHLGGWDLGIDQLLAREPPGALATTSPNRMGLPATVCFTLIAAALLLIAAAKPGNRRQNLAQNLILLVGTISLMPLIGYVYGVHELYGLTPYTGIAWPTTLGLLALGVGLLCARPNWGVMALVTADDPGGMSIRRLLLPALLLPVLLGLLSLIGEHRGWYGNETGAALRTILFILVFVYLIYDTGRWLSQLAAARRADEQALRDSERKYRILADHTSDWEFWLAPDGHYIYNSPACLRVSGYPAEAFYQDPHLLDRVIHPEDRATYQKYLSGGQTCAREPVQFRIIHRDGGVRWIDHVCVPVYDEAGAFLGVRGSNRDVTERKAAEVALAEARRRLSGIINSAMDAIITIDERQRIVLFNPAAERMFHCPAAEALGTSIDRFIPERFRAAHAHHIGHFAHTGETARAMGSLGAISGLRKDGEEFPIEASISQVLVDGRKLLSVILRDITERRKMEKVRDESLAAAQQAVAVKDQFMAVLSHELRTPLTPVVATASMLQEDEQLPARYREDVEMIRRNVELEARLIDDLLDVTRIARGKVALDCRPVELRTVIQHAVQVCTPDLEERHLHFAVNVQGGPYVVDADAGRLQQVFWNLIKNAAKFTPQGGCVGVRVNGINGHVITEVSDSGVGIEPDVLPRIFRPFDQGEASTTRRFGGLGLGLTISKAMVEMHHGQIEAHSEGRGKGATFTVTLPIRDAHAAPPEPADTVAEPTLETSSRQLRILLVEDHADTARIMKRLLTGQGHRVQVAGDVASALQLAEAQDFDLLLSDLGLPDGSGLTLMQELRARGHTLPGIALSGYGQDSDIEQSKEAGFLAHLTKPASPRQLQDAISAIPAHPQRRPPDA